MNGDSRTAVLAAIARAQGKGRTRRSRMSPEGPVDPGYRVELDPGVDAIALLVDRVIDYRATVIDVRGGGPRAVAMATAEALAQRGIDRAVVPAGLPNAWRPDGISLTEDDELAPAALDAFPAALTSSAAAVASTGTILLDHGPDQGRRAISLVPDVHVCIVNAASVFGELPAAIRTLGPRRIMTWISGPSATSDIELVRVEGVHGPRTLIVIIHDDLPPSAPAGSSALSGQGHQGPPRERQSA
jgi:L-lactate dehydrogenase complex protein LldG